MLGLRWICVRERGPRSTSPALGQFSNPEMTPVPLTHWGRDKMDDILQTTFSSAFPWMKMCYFRLKYHWCFVPRGLINNIPALVQIMVWRRPGDKPLSELMMVSLPTHMWVTRPQWVKVTVKDINKIIWYLTTAKPKGQTVWIFLWKYIVRSPNLDHPLAFSCTSR